MIPGLSGSLLSHDAVAAELGKTIGSTTVDGRWFRRWHGRTMQEMGPASSARQVYDRVALPLAAGLGFRVAAAVAPRRSSAIHALLCTRDRPVAALIVTEWACDPAAAWHDAARAGIFHGLRWSVCMTGPLIRIYDALHTYSRRFVQFDLDVTAHEPVALELLWALLGANAFADRVTALDRAIELSEQHRVVVRGSLQQGVEDALISLLRAFGAARHRRLDVSLDHLFEESLIVIYRILFLLFAEARGLVPHWHLVYRDSYTIESLQAATERQSRPVGLWESIQAIARLAHRGCHAGTLRVPPFNGRLFSPAHAPLAASATLDDGAVREALLALTTRRQGPVRCRIAYADLGVEQLGGVYERILDYTPVRAPQASGSLTLIRVGRRKATGTFYTPRALTEFMVRRALAPLVDHASAERILALRVVDPAMGSGAFLVAACRYLAAAYESALVRAGDASSGEILEGDRAGFRRLIAQRCLFGVDNNPMAVQLARLSLWLATLSRDKPLTFLDHHLRVGNSLAGISVEHLLCPPPRSQGRRASPDAQLPLFDLDQLDRDMHAMVASRLPLAFEPDDNIEQVRIKERVMAALESVESPSSMWRRVANLWCADWFREPHQARTSDAFAPLVDHILGRGSVLPPHISKPLLQQSEAIAARARLFHWQLEFPEVFQDSGDRAVAHSGFDAVIGNPPWEVLRGERESNGDTALTAFSRRSGAYSWQGDGHANLYQLFLERALRLTRTGGRIALVLPSGFALDHGSAPLRSALLDRTSIDTFITVENRDGLFPIHRGLKFLLVTATHGTRTHAIPCRCGVRSARDLERLPDSNDVGAVDVPRTVLEKFSGDQLVIPEIRGDQDVAILAKTVFQFPPLSSPQGWNVRFGRELNATDDKQHFVAGRIRGHLPVLEGKQIAPFVAQVDGATHCISESAAARLLSSAVFQKPRLAYRDVASASNRLTLIAAIVPRHVVTTHTLFCLKGDIEADIQTFLCGILNSFVANYLVRMRVGTHVTVAIIEQLPVPRVPPDSAAFQNIVALTARVITTPSDHATRSELQAYVGHAYRLRPVEFQYVLDTFPLVPLDERRAALEAFSLFESSFSLDTVKAE